jgi:hypothetical protein
VHPSITRIVCPNQNRRKRRLRLHEPGLHAPYTRRSAAVSPRARARARERLPPAASASVVRVAWQWAGRSWRRAGTETAPKRLRLRQFGVSRRGKRPPGGHAVSTVWLGQLRTVMLDRTMRRETMSWDTRVIAGPGRRASRVLLPGRPGPAGYRGRRSLQPAGLAPPALASRVLSTLAFVVKGYCGFLRDWVPEACATLCCTHI